MSSVKNRNDVQNYINYKQNLNKQKFVKQHRYLDSVEVEDTRYKTRIVDTKFK